LGRYDRPSDALKDYQKALDELEVLQHWDPNNKLWERDKAFVQLLVSDNTVDCAKKKTSRYCKLEDANELSLEALATLQALASSDASNDTKSH
jgi:hypothetical protein